MNNWSIDEKILKKEPKIYAIWKLNQMANFGLGGEKISASDYLTYANKVTIDDPWRKKYLNLLVYGENDSHWKTTDAAKDNRGAHKSRLVFLPEILI